MKLIEIKDIYGNTRFSTPINKGAKGKFTLMREDYIVLPFSVPEPVYFKLGDYVDLSGVLDDALGGMLSKVYEVVEPVKPTFNTSTGGYDYNLRLDAYYWKWKNKKFKYTPEHAGYEASWSLTAPLDVQMGVFLRNLKALGYTYRGSDFQFVIDSTVENKAVAMAYDNISLLDALFSMAGKEKWNCDCWITDNIIHFGRNEYGDSVKLELGVEASAMTRSESKGTYATRIYAFGSTRNIPENYRPVDEQAVVNGVVQRRLMLPAGTPFIDVYPNMSEEEAIEDVVVFDDVYPRRVGTLSDVKTVDRALTGDNNIQAGTFKAYQYKDTGLDFKDDYILKGQELEIIFQSGKLNGMKFGAIFEPEGTPKGGQIWEIRANEDYGRLLPDETMRPENGDKYILTGFDIQLVSDQYVPTAERELKEKAQKYADQRKKDDGTYNTTLDSAWVYEDRLRRFYEFGQKVTLVNKAFFEVGRESRILGWTFNLDIPWDNPTYTIGESMPYSRINDMEEKIESLTYKGQTYTGSGGGSGIYIIRANDTTAPSDSNVFSARRSLATLLRKDKTDQTNYLLKLLGGIISPYLESPDFVPGAMGAGYTIKTNADGQSYAEVDKLLVRMKAVFQTLSIMETELAGADFLFNSSGARAKIAKVEVIEKKRLREKGGKPLLFNGGKRAYSSGGTQGSTVYRCYFLTDDGDTAIENRFRPGNLVRSQTFNIKAGVHENVSNHYWWRMVTDTGKDWIELSDVYCDTDSDIPKVDDVMVQLGDTADTDYQSAIALSAYGDGAPSLTFYTGINSYSLSGKDVFTIAYDRVAQECYVKSYGRFYAGDREETNFVKYTKENGMEIKAKRFLFSNGEDIETRIEATEGRISLKLRETGIDIESGNVTVTADKFKVQGANGTPVAVFTNVGGVPKLRAENIDVDNLNVKNITGGHGKLGNVTIVEGTIGGFEIKGTYLGASKDGIGLHISNSWVSIREDDISVGFGKDALGSLSNIRAIGLFVNNVVREYPTPDANVAVYIEASGVEYKGLDADAWNGNHALYIPKGDICGFRLRTRRMGESGALDKMDSIIMAVKKDMTLDLLSNVEDGQTYFIRNHTDGDVNIRGYISDSGNTDTGYKTIAIARGDLAILIYDKYNSVYTFNYAGRK